MTRTDLKYKLWSLGYKNNKIAEEYGCTKQFICEWFGSKAESEPLKFWLLDKLKTLTTTN